MTAELVEAAQQVLDDIDGVVTHKEIAQKLKTKLDKEKSGTWHVIIGTHFAGNITNDAGTIVNFQVDNVWYLIFRSGPPEKVEESSRKK
jgi:hypothetical protein